MAKKVKRDASDFGHALHSQINLLRADAAAYDGGSEDHGKRLAVGLFTVIGNQRSLLSRLGVRDTLPYMDTAHGEPPPGVIMLDAGLCIMSAMAGPDGATVYKPFLDHDEPGLPPERVQPRTAFRDWWEQPIESRFGFTREDLVVTVRNEDGGAHIDRDINAAYLEFSKNPAMYVTFEEGDGRPVNSPALASIRQMTHELLDTLDAYLIEDDQTTTGFRVRDPLCPLRVSEKHDVDRNDPCPCGSGKKFKKCFLLREPRRSMRLPMQAAS